MAYNYGLLVVLAFAAAVTCQQIYPLPGGDGPIQAKHYVQEIVSTSMPCLMNLTIEVVAYNEPGYYLRSFVVPRTAVLPPDQRTYQMFANPQLFNTSFGPNSPAAMHAIITHELNHILDYSHMDTVQLAAFGLEYAANYTFLIWYEHEDDHKVLELGFGEGLKAYREWIYGTLTPDELEAKLTEYYTPWQIDAWMADNNGTYNNPCDDWTLFNYVCDVCHYPDDD